MKKVFIITLIFHLCVIGCHVPSSIAATVEEEAGRKSLQEKEKNRGAENKQLQAGKMDQEKKTGRGTRDAYTPGEEKDPRLACLLSLAMPGSGHLYLRRDLKGTGFCLGAATGYSLAGYSVYRYYASSGSGSNTTGIVTTGLFLFAAGVVHAVSVIEAYTDAEQMNLSKGKGALLHRKIQEPEIIVEK